MESKKEKIIKILKRILVGLSIGFNIVFIIAIIVGSVSSKKVKNDNNVNNEIVEVVGKRDISPRFVTYDDDQYTISLTLAEVVNYDYSILEEGLFNYDYSINSIEYDSNTYNDNSGGIWDDSRGYSIRLENGYFKYYTYDDEDGTQLSNFEYGFVIQCISSDYSGVKSAIETALVPPSINDGIFDSLTESTVGFIGVLNNGIQSMTSVFYDSVNSQLTTIGLLSVIVVAVVLAYWLFRLLIGLIRMRG